MSLFQSTLCDHIWSFIGYWSLWSGLLLHWSIRFIFLSSIFLLLLVSPYNLSVHILVVALWYFLAGNIWQGHIHPRWCNGRRRVGYPTLYGCSNNGLGRNPRWCSVEVHWTKQRQLSGRREQYPVQKQKGCSGGNPKAQKCGEWWIGAAPAMG